MKIVLDAMGSDTCPGPEVEAAVQAYQKYGDRVILVGPEADLRPRLEALAGKDFPVDLVDATETISMEDKGMALALKAKRKNSRTTMAVGIDLVKSGEADAFVTAGNTGGGMATAFFRLGVIQGVERPALAGIFPVKDGRCVVLDIGANPDVQPEHLLQFGIMGSLYAQKVLGVAKPRVGLLSNGEEGGKGNQLVKGAYPLLAGSGLNFIGNLEGKELFGGAADVCVTDGFTGNILLKSSEAVAKLLTDTIKVEMMKSLRTKLGGMLAKPAFGAVRKLMDPGEVGAAALLGIDGLVFIGHGRSDAHALVSAIGVARQAVEVDLMGVTRSAIAEALSQPL